MNYEDVQKVSNAAKAKSNLVNTNFFQVLYTCDHGRSFY